MTEGLKDKIEIGKFTEYYPDGVLDLLQKSNCYSFATYELEQFLYGDNATRQEENKIILETDEPDVSAFFKLLVMNGAKE